MGMHTPAHEFTCTEEGESGMTQFVVPILECSRAGIHLWLQWSIPSSPCTLSLFRLTATSSPFHVPLRESGHEILLHGWTAQKLYYWHVQVKSENTCPSPACLPALCSSCQHETTQCLTCLETYLPSPFPCKTKYICQKQLRNCHSTEATCCWNQFLYAIKYSYPTDSVTTCHVGPTSHQDPSGLFVSNKMALTSIFCGLPHSAKCYVLWFVLHTYSGQIPELFPFCRWGEWGWTKLSHRCEIPIGYRWDWECWDS